MAQILHQRAKTTHAIREDIQRSSTSVTELSRRYSLNPKTVRKWRRRTSVEDERMGPKQPSSTSLSNLEEAAAVAFRRTTLLPLDDCLFALQRFIPHLTRSSLHRLYKRHDISQLPRTSSFKRYPIGYLHMDICEVRTGDSKAYLFVATDRTSKFVHARLYQLRSHLKDYLWAYNSARPLRTLKGKTPIGFILERWQDEPERFHENPVYYFPRPYT